MVRLESLARPKEIGGWGIKNIYLLCNALAAKNLRRALFMLGMWNEVIHAKYLSNCNVINWIRGDRKKKKGISNIWSSLLHSFPVMNNWLAWKSENGNLIRLGEYPLIGSTSFFKLFDVLLNSLHEKQCFFIIYLRSTV